MTGVSVQAASARGVGKVILLGEHAVVYGSPAIAIGLTRGAEADVRRSSESSLSLGERVYVLGPESLAGSELPPARAFRALLGELSASPVAARASLAIPAGAG